MSNEERRMNLTEIHILSPNDELLVTLTEETGLISAPFREELNRIPDQPFSFIVESDVEESLFVVEENQVVFKDKDGDFRLYVIKELNEIDNMSGPETEAICMPAFSEELSDHIVVDRRFSNQSAQNALNGAVAGTRWIAVVEGEFGLESTNFYYETSIDAVWKVWNTWGGDIKDVIEFEGNEIKARKVKLLQRLGADRGKRFEIDHDLEEIQRTILSYPVTALYGRGASLAIEDEEGNETGGHSRYINFADVEWQVSRGDPVDKPLGQIWVGDLGALQKYGRWHNGKLLHREGTWQNSDIEDPLELLKATWDQLQRIKEPETNYRLTAHLLEHIAGYEHEKVSLGDTTRAINRRFARPIEIQSRVIALEYDLLDIEGTAVVELGQFLSVHEPDDRIEKVIAKVNDRSGVWDNPTIPPVTDDRFADIIPDTPSNFNVQGMYQNVLVSWNYDGASHIKHYEVYASEVPGFIPSPETLVFRGKTGSYVFIGETDKQYYFRVRAVNYHGKSSPFTSERTGIVARVLTEDLMFDPATQEQLNALEEEAQRLANSAKAEAEESANAYTQEEIQRKEQEILTTMNNRIVEVNQEIDRVRTDTYTIQSSLETFQTSVNTDISSLQETANNLQSRVGNNERDILSAGNKIISIEENIDSINGTVSTTITELSQVNSTLTEQQTTIEQQAGLIATKANQTSIDTLTGRVSTTEGSIETLAGQVSIKANASDVYTKTEINTELGKKVDTTVYSNKVAQIDTSINGILANVSAIESEVSDVDSRLVNAVSQLDIQAGLIAAKAEKTEVYTKTETDGRISTQINNAKAEIKITTDSIQQSVSSLSQTVEGHSTQFTHVNSSITQLNNSIEQRVTKTEYQTDQNNLVIRLDSAESRITQTESEIQQRVTTTTYNSGLAGKENTVFKQNAAPSHSNGRLWLDTSKTPNILYRSNGSAWVKATPTTAAEVGAYSSTDGATLAGRVTTAEGSLVTLAGEVTLKASKTEVDTLTGRVSIAEGSITTLAESIELKVDKDGVIGSINLSSEEFKIDVSKVTINGDLEVLNGTVRIKELAVGRVAIAHGAIDSLRLAHGVVQNIHIETATIESAKLKSVHADKLTAGIIHVDRIPVINSDKINVTSLSAISAILGNVTAGTISGVSIFGSSFNANFIGSGDDVYGTTRLVNSGLYFNTSNDDGSMYGSVRSETIYRSSGIKYEFVRDGIGSWSWEYDGYGMRFSGYGGFMNRQWGLYQDPYSFGEIALYNDEDINIIGRNINIDGSTTIKSHGDGRSILKLDIERSWSFVQDGVGSNAHLALRSDIANKRFSIKNLRGQSVAEFVANDPVQSGTTRFFTDIQLYGNNISPRFKDSADLSNSRSTIFSIPFRYVDDNLDLISEVARISLENYNSTGTGWYGITDRRHVGFTFYTRNNNAWTESARITPNGDMRLAGSIYAPGSYNTTTGSAPNAFVSSLGQLARSTSSIKYKEDVEDLWKDEYEKILELRPIWYRSKGDMDRKDWSYVGLIAEEVHEIEPRLVHYKKAYREETDEKGNKVQIPIPLNELEPEGVQYERLAVYLLPIIKKQQETIINLEKRVKALEKIA